MRAIPAWAERSSSAPLRTARANPARMLSRRQRRGDNSAMNYSIEDRVLALAGLIQAAWLTDRIAYTGGAERTALDATLGSLFRFDADSVAAVFGGPARVQEGLRILSRVLGNK